MKKYIVSLALVTGFIGAGDDVRISLGDKISTLFTPQGCTEIFELGFGTQATQPQEFFYKKVSALHLNRQELEALRDGNIGPITMSATPQELHQKVGNMIFDTLLQAVETAKLNEGATAQGYCPAHAATGLCKVLKCLVTEENMERGTQLIFGEVAMPSAYWESIIAQANLSDSELSALEHVLHVAKDYYNKRHALGDDTSEEACKKRAELDKQFEEFMNACMQEISKLLQEDLSDISANFAAFWIMLYSKTDALRVAIAERCLAELNE